MLKGYLGRQALSLRRGILSLNQDRHLCQGATCSGQGLSILGARVAPYNNLQEKYVKFDTCANICYQALFSTATLRAWVRGHSLIQLLTEGKWRAQIFSKVISRQNDTNTELITYV